MERIDEDKIIESLQVIKKVCEDNSDNDHCKKCPFEIDEECGIRDLNPCNWKILDYAKFQALG